MEKGRTRFGISARIDICLNKEVQAGARCLKPACIFLLLEWNHQKEPGGGLDNLRHYAGMPAAGRQIRRTKKGGYG